MDDSNTELQIRQHTGGLEVTGFYTSTFELETSVHSQEQKVACPTL